MNRKGQFLNISDIIRDNIHVGYLVQRIDKGIKYTKCFSSSKNSLEKNLELAQLYIDNLKNNLENTKHADYNKNNDLPKNISYIKNKEGSDQKNPLGFGFTCFLGYSVPYSSGPYFGDGFIL